MKNEPMATHPDYPFCTSFLDRHGRERWRFRRNGKTISLPGSPGEGTFDEAFYKALNGQSIKPAAEPKKTFSEAWALHRRTPAWKTARPITREGTERIADRFLALKVGPELDLVWGDVPITDVRRRHIAQLLGDRADTPHAAWRMLVVIRKMIRAALDAEWIEIDPTLAVMKKPETEGHKAWSDADLEAFRSHWSPGTTPRLVFCLALWLGNRRLDVANLRWSQRTTRKHGGIAVPGFNLRQHKTDASLFVPEAPELTEVLNATERKGPHVLLTAYGKPFSDKSLTGRMADWTKAAGLERGRTIHGLRKTLGRLIAEGGGTTRQIMAALGHEDIEHAELYSRDAEQIRLVIDAYKAVANRIG